MIITIDKKWIKEYKILNQSIDQAVNAAIKNLKKVVNPGRCRIWHLTDTNDFEEVVTQGLNAGIIEYTTDVLNTTDVLDFALNLYYPISRRERIKQLFREMINENAEVLICNLGFDIPRREVDEEKRRVYFYTDCPECGSENFYFSLDKTKKNIYVGCINDECKYHNRKCVDIIGFVQKQYNMSYNDAIEFLAELMGIEIISPFDNTNTSEDDENSHDTFETNEQNPAIYKSEGAEDGEYIITNRVMDALQIRRFSMGPNIFAIHSNEISELQLKEVCDCIPKAVNVLLALDSDTDSDKIEREVLKLKDQGFNSVGVCKIPPEFKNFYEMGDKCLLLNAVITVALNEFKKIA